MGRGLCLFVTEIGVAVRLSSKTVRVLRQIVDGEVRTVRDRVGQAPKGYDVS